MRDDIYLIDVVARATDAERIELATLRSLQVPLPNGRTAALGQFATFDYTQEYPLVWRRDRAGVSRARLWVGLGGAIYTVFVFFGVGLQPFLLALVLAAAGLPFYLWRRLRGGAAAAPTGSA